MLTKEEAHRAALVALDIIHEMPGNANLGLVLIEPLAVETELAWLFPFNTSEYVQTGNLEAMAIGVGPIVVNKETGFPFISPPMPTELFLEQYAANGGKPYDWF